MKITKNKVVTLKYKMFDAQNNNLLDDEIQQSIYLHGSGDGIFEKIEEQLENKEIGYNLKIQLEPDDAFGEYDAELLRLEDKSRFPADIAIGMVFEGIPGEESIDSNLEIHVPKEELDLELDDDFDDEDDEESEFYVVTDIVEDKVVLDANHPLAGIAIRFDITVVEIREATEEEIENGYIGDDYDNMLSVASNANLDDDYAFDDEDENNDGDNSNKPTLH
ncbi:MAG: hypothetical protein RLZZ210_1454 [Pseudomonadota bacterium]|jgi:FKBP-type peptidyl-prolyl cis-trans isomerase SlyD